MNKKLNSIFSEIFALLCALVLTFGCSLLSTSKTDDNNIPSVPGVDTPVDGLSSIQFASAMQCGWNLGNTFDSAEYDNKTNKGSGYETAWGMPITTKKMINTVAAKGFKTIRIPISWHNHISDGENLTIDPEWLSRVKTVVDWARDNKMFVIINIHHDNLTSSQMSTTYGFSVNTDSAQQAASKKYIEKIWTQVANYFKDYDNHLIFELLNEPRNIDGPNNGFGDQSNLSTLNALIAEYDQVALNAIRSTGGNNANRFVMAPYYAASPWKKDGWKVPSDSASDKILIAVHAYDPYSFAMGDMSDTDFAEGKEGNDLKSLFDMLKSTWVSKGYGVVMGEASATDKNNLDDRLAWFKSYISKAKAINCPVILWDNMQTASTGQKDVAERHGYLNRNDCTWYFPTLVNAMIETAGGSVDNPQNPDPTPSTPTATTIWTGSQDLKHWDGADGITLAANKFTSATASSKIRFTISKGAECTAANCANNYSTIHPITGWSNGNINFSEANSDSQLAVTPPASGTSTATISPDSASWSTIKSNGLIVYGHKVVITKIEILN